MSVARLDIAPLVALGPPLAPGEVERFSRHLLLRGFGEDAQRRVRNARVCVLGAGGLGSPVISYLAAAGVGTIAIVADDTVSLSNLQRQVIHTLPDVGQAKVTSARRAVSALDPAISVDVHEVRLDETNVDHILGRYDLVIDGTDNFATRYLVSDACERLGLPVVWGSVLQFDAQISVFWAAAPEFRSPCGANGGPTLRDLFPQPPPQGSVPSCAEAGVLGAMCGQVGSIMATEAIKLICGIGEVLLGRVLVLDALRARWTQLPLVATTPRTLADDGAEAVPEVATPRAKPQDSAEAASAVRGAAVGGTAGQVSAVEASTAEASTAEVTAAEVRERLAARAQGGPPFVLVDVREPDEHAESAIAGAICIPLAHLATEAGRGALSREATIVVHCAGGSRAGRAQSLLQGAGYPHVSTFSGGMRAWNTLVATTPAAPAAAPDASRAPAPSIPSPEA